MTGIRNVHSLWQVLVHSRREAYQGIPESIFFDREIVWHQQHLGLSGHVAYACLARKGKTLFALNYVSDVSQRISRRPEHRSRIENRFKGWADIVVNAVLHFALESGCRWIRSPSSELVLRHTDPTRKVGKELFQRTYDRTFLGTLETERSGPWWVADVRKNASRRLQLVPRNSGGASDGPSPQRTICVFHDIEGGMGHRREDPQFADHAEAVSPGILQEMLKIEKDLGVVATYNVVGILLEKVREHIEEESHCLAFHSFDHDPQQKQLERCRQVDYRLRGYRPPQSLLTGELTERNLTWYNFDWLALAEHQIAGSGPILENRVVKIPILADDYALYKEGTSFDRWADETLDRAKRNRFAAIGLHDCYGEKWMPYYGRFLESLSALGQFATMDQVADQTFLQAAS